MAALSFIAAIAVALAAPSPAPPAHTASGLSSLTAQRLAGWEPLMAKAAGQFGVPVAWLRAVMRAESGGRTTLDGRPITSAAGAMGLMQLMPDTWAELRARYRLGRDPYDPRDNIMAGAAYLRGLYIRYGYPALFAAYNAGPARVDAHLFHGAPLPAETRAYLAALGQPAFERSPPPRVHAADHLFFPLQASGAVGEPPPPTAAPGLFVPLTATPPPQR